jgi:hypothetical protein
MSYGSEKKAIVLRYACVAAGVLFASGRCWGSVVEVEIAGQVTGIIGQSSVLGGRVNMGDSFSGWYRYDSSALDTDLSDYVGAYQYSSSPYGISLNIGGLEFASDQQNLNFQIKVINDDVSGDSYELFSTNNLPALEGVAVSPIIWQLKDSDGSVLTSDAQIAPVPVTDWDSNIFRINCRSGEGTVLIDATISNATVVPEPATIMLSGFGIFLIPRYRRRA